MKNNTKKSTLAKNNTYIDEEFKQFLKENAEEVRAWPRWKLEFLESIENK